MYIVKHKPTGKYIRKTQFHYPFYYLNDPNRIDRVLTDDINKARVYSNMSGVTNSIGNRKIIGEGERVFRGEVRKYNIYDGHLTIDPDRFEVIEVKLNIGE